MPTSTGVRQSLVRQSARSNTAPSRSSTEGLEDILNDVAKPTTPQNLPGQVHNEQSGNAEPDAEPSTEQTVNFPGAETSCGSQSKRGTNKGIQFGGADDIKDVEKFEVADTELAEQAMVQARLRSLQDDKLRSTQDQVYESRDSVKNIRGVQFMDASRNSRPSVGALKAENIRRQVERARTVGTLAVACHNIHLNSTQQSNFNILFV